MATSAESKKRSKAIDRPFAPHLLKRASEIAGHYQIVMQFEDGVYFGRGLELPLVMNDGNTADECMKNTRESLQTAVAHMLENGQTPPAPAADQTRSVQVNIRLTNAEKLQLEQEARRKGFRGISDYVRHTALTWRE